MGEGVKTMRRSFFLLIGPVVGLALTLGAAGQTPDPCRGVAVLTIETDAPDANFNGRLVKVPLDGTGREVLFEAASDVYPQPNGSVFIKSRTSRSGHDLFYAAAGKAPGARPVAAAFDFVAAATAPDGGRAALAVRTGPELAWTIEIMELPPAGREPRRTAPPEGVRPRDLRWRTDGGPPQLVLLGTREGKPVSFGLIGTDEVPRWEELPAYVAADGEQFILNKSQSLDVGPIEKDGGPAIRVASAWWHGEIDEIVTIPGQALVSYEWACGRQILFVLGRRDDLFSAFIVDLRGRKVRTVLAGARGPVKLYRPGPAAAR